MTLVLSFAVLFAGVSKPYEERIVMMAAKGSRNGHTFPGHSHACLAIGFTDSSNPFYLFSKLNAGLLLLAPSAPTMREEHPLLIALEADRWTLMSINHTSQPGIESSRTQTPSSRIAALTNHRERLTNRRWRDPNSSTHMVALPWEDAE